MIEAIGYNKNHKDREENDFYATPPLEVFNILQQEQLIGTVLEPCCGMGHMVEGIMKTGITNKIIATDLINRGYGQVGLDYLKEDYPYTKEIGTVIINPPFNYIEEFVNKSIKIAERKVIVFARNQFTESESRYLNIFKDNPPSRIYQYVDRVSCAKGGDFNETGKNSMAFAWFVWDKASTKGETIFRWIRRVDKVS